MFQYGYTNFQKKGYRFASENEFFHASLKNRNAKLAQLVNHVDTKHTAYLEAKECGTIYGVGAWKVGEINDKPSMHEAYEMGKKV